MYNKIKYNELIEAIDKFHIQKKTSKENYSSIEIRDFDLFGFAFEDVDLSFVSFVNCNLKKTVFKNVYMCNTHFVNSDISGASFDKPAYKIHMKPILSDCIIDEETFIPEEYDYCEKTGYIIIDNCFKFLNSSFPSFCGISTTR